MQPRSVLLPDFFLGLGEILPSSGSELQALTEKKPLLHGVGAAADSQKGSLPGDFDELL